MLNRKQRTFHKKGLLKLVSLKGLMGKGLTNELKAAFPDPLPANELGISDLTLSLFFFSLFFF